MFTDREQWTEVRQRVLVEGVSRRKLPRKAGLHRKTLKKSREHSVPPGHLARYVQSTALGNKAIVAGTEAGVTFAYTESGTGAHRQMTLEPMEFLRRILSHVLPDGLHKVRYFGWLHPNARKRYHRAALLVGARIVLLAPAPPPPPPHLRCPHCGAFALQIVGRLPRARPP